MKRDLTGRRVDILDNGSLKIQYNRNRYYDYYTSRWATHDPLGITAGTDNLQEADIFGQYNEGLNLYAYVKNGPVNSVDPLGLKKCCYYTYYCVVAGTPGMAAGPAFGECWYICNKFCKDACGNLKWKGIKLLVLKPMFSCPITIIVKEEPKWGA